MAYTATITPYSYGDGGLMIEPAFDGDEDVYYDEYVEPERGEPTVVSGIVTFEIPDGSDWG